MNSIKVYISGPISGVEDYQKPFEEAEKKLIAEGLAVLNPAKLPEGLTKEQYMRINFAQIEAADIVLFLPGWGNSAGAKLERAYCEYIGKITTDSRDFLINIKSVTTWVAEKVKEVLGL